MELEDWNDIPDSMNPDDPENHTLEYEIGTSVKFTIGKKTVGGILVGVNEFGRPIVAYVGPNASGRKLTDNYRTTGWDSIRKLE